MISARLLKFLYEYDIEGHWEDEDAQEGKYFIFIPFFALKKFISTCKSFFQWGYSEAILKEFYVVVDLAEICDYFEIDIRSIYKKKEGLYVKKL